MEIATLGLGCFWGPEIKFNKLEGVVNTEVGYCGGNIDKTTYEEALSWQYILDNGGIEIDKPVDVFVLGSKFYLRKFYGFKPGWSRRNFKSRQV